MAGALSGHIVKDKTFFFVDYEKLRQIQGKNTGILATATPYEWRIRAIFRITKDP